jgi:hypothetical protein
MKRTSSTLDARGRNRLQGAGTLPAVWIPSRGLRDGRDLPRTRMVLVRQRTRLHPDVRRIVATLGRGWVQQFQLVQDRLDRVVLRVIPVAAPSSENLARMRKAACDVPGPGTGLEIQLVDHIESEASGKFRVSRALAGGEAESWTAPGPGA